jgi:hypothetical protein
MNVQMVERRMEDILWAQKALQGHDPTALKSKQQAGKLTMGTYFCFRLMIQQIVNGRLYQTMEKHKAELVRAIADRYAERMMIGIDEDGLDADDLGRFDFDDDEISMLSEKNRGQPRHGGDDRTIDIAGFPGQANNSPDWLLSDVKSVPLRGVRPHISSCAARRRPHTHLTKNTNVLYFFEQGEKLLF